MPLRTCGIERDRRACRRDAGLKGGLALGFGKSVGPQPVARLRQLAGRVEVTRVGLEPRFPDLRRPARARESLPILIERVGIVGRNLHRGSSIQSGYGT